VAVHVTGLTAEGYIAQSILAPHAYITHDFRDMMYPAYAERLTKQGIRDLIAFLKTL
jgi:hypothetical protein